MHCRSSLYVIHQVFALEFNLNFRTICTTYNGEFADSPPQKHKKQNKRFQMALDRSPDAPFSHKKHDLKTRDILIWIFLYTDTMEIVM
jgi:hypothetical protein